MGTGTIGEIIVKSEWEVALADAKERLSVLVETLYGVPYEIELKLEYPYLDVVVCGGNLTIEFYLDKDGSDPIKNETHSLLVFVESECPGH